MVAYATESSQGKASVFIEGTDGKRHLARERIKPVMCGKKCRGCPHKFYKYLVYRDGNTVKEKYIGVVKP